MRSASDRIAVAPGDLGCVGGRLERRPGVVGGDQHLERVGHGRHRRTGRAIAALDDRRRAAPVPRRGTGGTTSPWRARSRLPRPPRPDPADRATLSARVRLGRGRLQLGPRPTSSRSVSAGEDEVGGRPRVRASRSARGSRRASRSSRARPGRARRTRPRRGRARRRWPAPPRQRPARGRDLRVGARRVEDRGCEVANDAVGEDRPLAGPVERGRHGIGRRTALPPRGRPREQAALIGLRSSPQRFARSSISRSMTSRSDGPSSPAGRARTAS